MLQKVCVSGELPVVLKRMPEEIQRILEEEEIKDNISTALQILDSYYGTNRDPEYEGGYLVILYGEMIRQREEYKGILEHYHLQSNEYEFEDHYQKPEYDAEVVFRLYLCGSDYSIVIVQIIEKGDYTL